MALKALIDGFVAIGRGMNESVEPQLLRNNEIARAVNVDLSSGIATTRPGFRELPLWTEVATWKNNEDDDVDPMEYFRDGKFQGATIYRFQEQDFLVVVAGQLLWRINLATHELELYGWHEHINDIPKVNLLTWRCWFCQVEKFMIVQDGINPPYILTGRGIEQSKGIDIKGVIGTDSKMLKNTSGIVDSGAVIPLDGIFDTESFRVKVLMSSMVDNLAVGDYCTVRFRNDTTETGIITKVNQYTDPPFYEIKFEIIRDWTTYGKKRFDNVAGVSATIHHGMESVGRLETPEVPAGTATAFGHGRVFVVHRGRYIVAGDILKSWEPESVLRYTEIGYVNGGGALGVPTEMGEITRLAFMQNAMSGTSLGSLLAFCENGVCAFSVQTPRSQWFDTDISTVLFTTDGLAGQYGVQSVNNDMMFVSWDGIRSIRHTTSTVAGSGIIFENRPLSEKVKKIWSESAQWAWKYTSMCYADNNVYFLTKAKRGHKLEDIPIKLNLDDETEIREPIEEVRFKGIVCFSPITASGLDNTMVFNGVWTGYDFLHILDGNLQGHRQPIVIARDSDENLQVLAISNIHGNDAGKSRTVSRIYTGAYDFLAGMEERSSDTLGKIMVSKSLLKRFEYMDIWVSGVYDEATVRLFCRPMGYPSWVSCGEFTVEAVTSPTERINAWPQFRRKQRITAPRLQCDEVTGWDLMTASEFQFCIEWEGGLKIDRALFFATLLPEEKNFACVQPQGRILSATGFDDYDYVVGGAE